MQISEQFCPKSRTRKPKAWTQNGHSRSFKVIYFDVDEKPPRDYNYNIIIVASYVNIRKI